MNEPILIKLYPIGVKDLRICMKKDNPDPRYFKGDN